MKIRIGNFYENKTWRFLLPCLSWYGDNFKLKFNSIFRLAAGVHDMYMDGSPLISGRNIYILIDRKYQPLVVDSFFFWIKYEDYYVTDYPMGDSRKHMLVLKIPIKFHKAYDMFLLGKYSKMYTEEEVDYLFIAKERLKEKKILVKPDTATKKDFIKKVNEEFNTEIQELDSESEMELPLKIEEEIFNSKKGDTVFFSDDIAKNWLELKN